MDKNEGGGAMKFSLIPILLAGKSISQKAQQALRENRLKDAADMLVKDYGLSCVEAGQLLGVFACEHDKRVGREPVLSK
jgi:hypothetical protein